MTLALGVALAADAAAIGLTITPNVFTNDFVGQITFIATNLTPGMTVNVDVYGDVNSNGIIDAGDLVVTSFQLTDGKVPLVAGIRNLNVPGDDDGLTNAQILVLSQFPDVSGSIWPAGTVLFRVSDPAGKLTSATQAVTVVQRYFPQSVTGRLIAAGSGQPLTNSVLIMGGLRSGSYWALTDAEGYYRFYCPPGRYAVVGFNNQGAIFPVTQAFNVTCGQIVTNDIIVSNGTFSVTGRVTDSATGAGIPNVLIDAATGNGAFRTFSMGDTNGNYTLKLPPNTWGIHPANGVPAARGYVDPVRTNISIINAGVANVNFALSAPTAIAYGTIADTNQQPVSEIALDARNTISTGYHVVGRSFAGGAQYCLALLAGAWTVTPNSGDSASLGFTATNTGLTVTNGQAVNLNLVVLRTNWPSLQMPVRLSVNQFQLLLNGLAGQNYAIQATANLGSTNWLLVLLTNAPCNTIYLTDPGATNSQRFYRAEQLP